MHILPEESIRRHVVRLLFQNVVLKDEDIVKQYF